MKNISKKKKKLIHRIIFLLFALIALLVLVDFQIRPVIKSLSQYEARTIASRAINDCILNELDKDGVTYDSLIKISKDEDGKVTAIETNIVKINLLKSKITKNIIDVISNYKSEDLSIPIGTLTGIQFFSGRGPSIQFRIIPSSNVTAVMYSKFVSAGINQVLHQIMVKINVDVMAIIPGYTSTVQVESEVCIAETVIVGNVPEGYFNLGGNASGISNQSSSQGDSSQTD